MNKIQADIQESGAGQITYTTRKTNETCFVPIFAQTLQVFDRLSKDKNLPPLLQRLRVEDKVTDHIKQHQQRRKAIEDIIKVMPAESMQSIIDEYRKTGNAAKLLKKARTFDYFQRDGYNRHIKKYFQDLVKRGVLEDEIISCWTGGRQRLWQICDDMERVQQVAKYLISLRTTHVCKYRICRIWIHSTTGAKCNRTQKHRYYFQALHRETSTRQTQID